MTAQALQALLPKGSLLGTGGEAAAVFEVSVPLVRDAQLVHIQLALKQVKGCCRSSFLQHCKLWRRAHTACSMHVMPLLAAAWVPSGGGKGTGLFLMPLACGPREQTAQAAGPGARPKVHVAARAMRVLAQLRAGLEAADIKL
jgi:hypothetical protein